MSTKPIHLFSTLNFWLQDTQEIPESVGIVFLYRPGRVVWNFCLCALDPSDLKLKQFLAVFRGFFKDYFPYSQKVSRKPIHLFSTLNFWLQGANEIPGSVGIVSLYRPGQGVWNLCPCVL